MVAKLTVGQLSLLSNCSFLPAERRRNFWHGLCQFACVRAGLAKRDVVCMLCRLTVISKVLAVSTHQNSAVDAAGTVRISFYGR